MGVLLHEIGHANLYHQFGGGDWRDRQHIFPREELMIIRRLEKSAMQKLGFGFRSDHSTGKDRQYIYDNDSRIRRGQQIISSYFIYSPSPIN